MYRELSSKDYFQQIWVAADAPEWNGAEPDIFISRCGHFYGKGKFSMNYNVPYPFMYIFLKGNTHIEIDGHHFTAKKGDILFAFEGQHKKLQEDPQSPLENWYLDLQGKAVQSIMMQLGIAPGRQFFKGEFDKSLKNIITELCHECEQEKNSPLSSSFIVWRLLESLRALLPPKQRVAVSLADRVRFIIEQDFRFNLCIEEISEKLSISRSTLFRHFKEKYKQSPKQYLEELRLNYACQQLKAGAIPIQEIAGHSGYSSVNHFIRMFKKRFGSSPQQYRKEINK